ncbi:zinc finger protein 532-like isoform X2 [Rhodnius prolixus]|uniref:zinc finger protein 532-like isoform X2 n=1 Tax=Rhodnius prolixus TaxID=13249 RepID=UPI003D18F0DC
MSEVEQKTTNVKKEVLGIMPEIKFSARKKCLKVYLKKLLNIRKKYVVNESNKFGGSQIFACCGCFKRFYSYLELEEHLTRPVGQLVFRCQVCLSTIETLNLCQVAFHSSEIHINEAGYHPVNIGLELVAAAPLDEMIELKEVCPECRKEVSCIIVHLWHSKPEHPVLQCPCCYVFVTRNVCRYNLHLRIHKYMAPFICPDCAKVYKRFEDLQNHLKETCRHLEETVRYKCPACEVLFQTNADLLRHVFTDHNPVKYKCHLCPSVLNLASEKNIHYNQKHRNELSSSTLRQIKCFTLPHQCAICGEEELRGFSYERHVRIHFSGPNFKFIFFMCDCGFLTMYKGSYLLHKSTPCPSLNFSSLKVTQARLKMCTSCCDLKFYNGIEPFICEACDNFETEMVWCYKCTICFSILEYSMDYVILHLQNEHGKCNMETPYCYVEKVLSDTINSSVTDEQNDVNQPVAAENSVLKEETKDIFEQYSVKCKKCTASFSEMELLRSHYIAKHLEDTQGFLCLECGEAYKTVNSLSIHLRSHGIINTNAYISNYKVCNELPVNNYASDKPKAADQLSCPVCSEHFNNASEHNQHLRSHGMAFLKRIKQM